jgi:hypothetical protein
MIAFPKRQSINVKHQGIYFKGMRQGKKQNLVCSSGLGAIDWHRKFMTIGSIPKPATLYLVRISKYTKGYPMTTRNELLINSCIITSMIEYTVEYFLY